MPRITPENEPIPCSQCWSPVGDIDDDTGAHRDPDLCIDLLQNRVRHLERVSLAAQDAREWERQRADRLDVEVRTLRARAA